MSGQVQPFGLGSRIILASQGDNKIKNMAKEDYQKLILISNNQWWVYVDHEYKDALLTELKKVREVQILPGGAGHFVQHNTYSTDDHDFKQSLVKAGVKNVTLQNFGLKATTGGIINQVIEASPETPITGDIGFNYTRVDLTEKVCLYLTRTRPTQRRGTESLGSASNQPVMAFIQGANKLSFGRKKGQYGGVVWNRKHTRKKKVTYTDQRIVKAKSYVKAVHTMKSTCPANSDKMTLNGDELTVKLGQLEVYRNRVKKDENKEWQKPCDGWRLEFTIDSSKPFEEDGTRTKITCAQDFLDLAESFIPAYLADLEFIWYTIDEYLAFTETQLRFSKSRVGCWLFSDINQGRKNYKGAGLSYAKADRKHEHRLAHLTNTFGWMGINLGKVLKVQDLECERYRFKFNRFIELMSRKEKPGTKYYDSECSMLPQKGRATMDDSEDQGDSDHDNVQDSFTGDKSATAHLLRGGRTKRKKEQRTRLGINKFKYRTVARISQTSPIVQQKRTPKQKRNLHIEKLRVKYNRKYRGAARDARMRQLDSLQSDEESSSMDDNVDDGRMPSDSGVSFGDGEQSSTKRGRTTNTLRTSKDKYMSGSETSSAADSVDHETSGMDVIIR
jgi:hypothetical protein